MSTKSSTSKRRVNNVNVVRGKVFQNQINDETLKVNKYNVIVEMIDITNFATLYSRNVHRVRKHQVLLVLQPKKYQN